MKLIIPILLIVFFAFTKVNAQNIQYKYDKVGRLAETDYPNQIKVLYTYDQDGNRTMLAINPNTSKIQIDQVVSDVCSGDPILIPYTTSVTYNSSNIFTAQLSNNLGDFTSPINIGTVNKTSSDTIHATIPTSIINGTDYRIRILSSSPAIDTGISIENITISQKPNTSAISGNSNVAINSNENYSILYNNGSTYNWTVTNGSIIDGIGTNKLSLKWGNNSGVGIVQVVETNSNGCIGTPVVLYINIGNVFSLNPDSLHFGYQGGTQTLHLICDTTWTLTSKAQLQMFFKHNGIGNENLDINVSYSSSNFSQTDTLVCSCGSQTKKVNILLDPIPSTGINSIKNDEPKISIYPNPTIGLITIDFKNIEKNKGIKIYDFTGKLVKDLNTNNDQIQINLDGSSKGIYTINVITEKRTINSKVILE